MSKYKLINGLNCLSSAEWTHFDRFLKARSKTDSDHYLLFTELNKSKNEINQDKLISKVKKKNYKLKSDKYFLNLMSKLYLQLEDFLVYNEVTKDPKLKDRLLISILNKRGLYRGVNLEFEDRCKKQKPNPSDFFHHDYRLYDELYFSDNPIKYRKGIGFLEDLSNRHLIEFKEKAVFNMIELLNWGALHNHHYESLLIQYKTSIANLNESAISEMGSLLLELYETDNLKILYQICEKVFKYEIEPETKYNTLVSFYLIIYISKAFNKGTLNDSGLGLKIYEYALATKALMINDKIPPTRFINMVSAISAFSEYENVQAFINKWNIYLDLSERAAFTKLAKAMVCMYFNRMEQIVEYLRGVTFKEAKFRIRARTMELLFLFESRTNNYNLFYDYLNNVKRQVNRNKTKLSSKTYSGYSNFIKVIELMAKRDFAKVYIKPERYKNLMYRTWVKKQLKKVKD